MWVAGQLYWEFRNGERSAGEMMEIQPEGGEVPPNWSVYLAVADCDASVARVQELGCTAIVPAMDVQTLAVSPSCRILRERCLR